jgi:2-polyprenyl-3-methyl-5-hydroxy-6-metoxy-1,4-benzoquinol methylase
MPIAQPTYFSQLKTQIKHLPIIGAIATATWTQLKHLYQTTKQSYTRIILNILMKRVEYYQPLYHHPLNPTKHPQRICIDRATTIYQTIEAWGKGGRILDIGCSLGYFAYYFAERDYLVEGIDFDPKNIKVCKLLQNLNIPKVNFAVAEFSSHYLKTITVNQFDIVFLFSVMHHITHAHGLDYAQTLMAELTEKIPVLFIELAIKEEQTTAAWRQSLPENELAIFDKCTDISIEKIGTYPNHLSTVLRPLYLVKKKTMTFCGKTYPVHARKFIPYHGFYEAGCRYYDCGDTFVKKYLPSISMLV